MSVKTAVSLVETADEAQISILESALNELAVANDAMSLQIQERLANLDLMMDNIGWSDITGLNDEGPSLSQLKQRSGQLKNATALNPHMKRGASLRSSYVWSDPIRYDGVPGLNGAPIGKGTTNIGRLVLDPTNQHYVFGSPAREKRERALFTDGLYLLLGDNDTKKLHPVPIMEISADYRNPDNNSEIWAYRRTWNRWSMNAGATETIDRWYFTDLFYDNRVDQIMFNGKRETVDQGKTIIDGMVNTQIGWAYGFPDSGCVLEWVRIYNKFIRSGEKMNDAMASIWATVKTQSTTGTTTAGVKVAAMTGAGNTAVGQTELAPLATAGKTYDFHGGIPILAIVASGLEVSVVALSSSPGDAGASYGAAQTLSLPEQLSTERRRNWNIEYDLRVLRWMGARDPKATFPPLLDAAELLRRKQAAQLDWNSGLYTPEEAKGKFEGAEGNSEEVSAAPKGVLIPNNEKSLQRKDIDVDTKASGVPGQGKSSGIGPIPGQTNDKRSDQISK